jgi:hypothetical protein
MNATATGAQRRTRAPRVRVPNQEQAIVAIGSERLPAILDCLSLTGGRIRSGKRFAAGTFADLKAKTVSGNFTAAIELLGERRGGTQAFRFVQMGPDDRRRLQDALNKMQAHGFGEKQPNAWNRLLNLGREVLTPAARR